MRIVVAIDSFDTGRYVLERAIARGLRHGAEVWVVMGDDVWRGPPRARAGRRGARADGTHAAVRVLAWVERVSRGRIDPRRVYLGSGPFAQDILMLSLETLPRWLVVSSSSAEDAARVCRLIGCVGVTVAPSGPGVGDDRSGRERFGETLILPFREPRARPLARPERGPAPHADRWTSSRGPGDSQVDP